MHLHTNATSLSVGYGTSHSHLPLNCMPNGLKWATQMSSIRHTSSRYFTPIGSLTAHTCHTSTPSIQEANPPFQPAPCPCQTSTQHICLSCQLQFAACHLSLRSRIVGGAVAEKEEGGTLLWLPPQWKINHYYRWCYGEVIHLHPSVNWQLPTAFTYKQMAI